tara:strand:- start:824 stop:1936 length:1113 start_codon:yes stop_codon:yes gene_type:complete
VEYLGRNTERFKTVQVLNDLTVEKVLFVNNINDTRPTAGQVLTWDGRDITWKDDTGTPLAAGCGNNALVQYDTATSGFECSELIYSPTLNILSNDVSISVYTASTFSIGKGTSAGGTGAWYFTVGSFGATQTLTSWGGMLFDSSVDIELNADGGDINFKDNTAQLAVINTNGLDFTDNTGAGVIFEGATDNAHKTTLSVIDPTGTRAINLPDASGTVALTTDIPDEVVSSGTFILKQTKVTFDQAACNNLHTGTVASRTIVATAGSDKIIVPVEVFLLVDRNGADTSAGDLIVGYNGTSVYTYALKYIRRWMYGILTDMTYIMGNYAGKGANNLTGGVNVPLTITTSAAMTTNSLTSLTVYTSYYVIDNS